MEKNPTLRELVNTKGLIVNHEFVKLLRTTFQGAVFTPEDAGYEEARKIWNAHIDRYPGIIARCSG